MRHYIQIDDYLKFIYTDGEELYAKVKCKNDPLLAVDTNPYEDEEDVAWVNPTAASIKRIELVRR